MISKTVFPYEEFHKRSSVLLLFELVNLRFIAWRLKNGIVKGVAAYNLCKSRCYINTSFKRDIIQNVSQIFV